MMVSAEEGISILPAYCVEKLYNADNLETKYRILMQEKPETAMRVAVRGMMPRNTVCKDSLKRLHIYADANYEQQAQKPIVLE